jgi:transcriptional regulator with XRE-family HTH domain
MNAIDAISEAIARECNSGVTQQALAERAGLTKGHINRIVNGHASVGGLAVNTLIRLFPQLDAVITDSLLNGVPAGDNIQAGGSVISRSPGASMDAIQAVSAPVKLRLLESIMKMDLDNEVQIQILQNILEMGDS